MDVPDIGIDIDDMAFLEMRVSFFEIANFHGQSLGDMYLSISKLKKYLEDVLFDENEEWEIDEDGE